MGRVDTAPYVNGIVVSGVTIGGSVTFAAGTNISVTQSGQTITIAGTAGGGDASTNTSTSVDSEVALFSGTAGKTLKRATGSGLAKLASGVLGIATAGTDYSTPSSTDTLTNKTLDGTATGNSVTNASTIQAKRQNDTTNSSITGVRIETGWGVFAQGAASNKSETVTFNTAFNTTPIVVIASGGDQTGGTIALGNGGNVEKGPFAIKAYGESTTGFTAHAHTSDGTAWSATANVYYKWMAIGN